MGFKKLSGVPLSEEEQGLIRYTCLTYAKQPPKVQRKIQRLCLLCAGAYSAALFDVMCTKKSITAIALANYVSETQLYRFRKAFYEAW